MLLAEAIHANELAVQRASIPELRRMLPILRQAEGELATELGRWLKRISPEETYTRVRHRSLMAQLAGVLDTVERRLGPAMAEDVVHEAAHHTTAAMANLNAMAEAGSMEFEGVVRPLRFDVASILADENHALVGRMYGKGGRFGVDVANDIRSRMALGMIRGETVDEMTSRMLASTHLIRVFKARGPDGVAGGIAESAGRKYRSWAQSIVRTELVNGYSEAQARGIREADEEDPGWGKKWDAANDARVCKWCNSLDKQVVSSDQSFRGVGRFGSVPYPPLHRCCRCAIVPWRNEWTKKQGRKSRDAET